MMMGMVLLLSMSVAISGTYGAGNSGNKAPAFSRLFSFSALTEIEENLLLNLKKSLTWSKARRLTRLQKTAALSSLASIVQAQIRRVQDVKTCDSETRILVCGHADAYCGLACQIHYRIMCVGLSYALGLPLFHDEVSRWPYNKPWRQAFELVGSSCKHFGPGAIYVTHEPGGPRLHQSSKNGQTRLRELPFAKGMAVPRRIGELVERLHESPFRWWAGQFAKYMLRLSQDQQLSLNEAKAELGLDRPSFPTIGIHVRRTDKMQEAMNSRHSIESYFREIIQYASHLPEGRDNKTIRVFVASDQHTILKEAKQRFVLPEWEVIGFESNMTLRSPAERRGGLDEIIRDFFILAESDYVVCGFTSNVCRLLLELTSSVYPDGSQRLKSIDGVPYYFHLAFGTKLILF